MKAHSNAGKGIIFTRRQENLRLRARVARLWVLLALLPAARLGKRLQLQLAVAIVQWDVEAAQHSLLAAVANSLAALLCALGARKVAPPVTPITTNKVFCCEL